MFLGRYEIRQPIVRINPNGFRRNPLPTLGGGLLKQFVVTIDQQAKIATFSRKADGFVLGPSPSVRHCGFYYQRETEGLRIIAGITGSSLDAHGLKINDRVIAIYGKPTSKMSDAKWSEFVARNESLKLSIRREEELIDVELPVMTIVP